jgi:hypothetical protein
LTPFEAMTRTGVVCGAACKENKNKKAAVGVIAFLTQANFI